MLYASISVCLSYLCCCLFLCVCFMSSFCTGHATWIKLNVRTDRDITIYRSYGKHPGKQASLMRTCKAIVLRYHNLNSLLPENEVSVSNGMIPYVGDILIASLWFRELSSKMLKLGGHVFEQLRCHYRSALSCARRLAVAGGPISEMETADRAAVSASTPYFCLNRIKCLCCTTYSTYTVLHRIAQVSINPLKLHLQSWCQHCHCTVCVVGNIFCHVVFFFWFICKDDIVKMWSTVINFCMFWLFSAFSFQWLFVQYLQITVRT